MAIGVVHHAWPHVFTEKVHVLDIASTNGTHCGPNAACTENNNIIRQTNQQSRKPSTNKYAIYTSYSRTNLLLTKDFTITIQRLFQPETLEDDVACPQAQLIAEVFCSNHSQESMRMKN